MTNKDKIIDLHFGLAKIIYPRLVLFRKHTYSYPGFMTFDGWKRLLEEMIWAFKSELIEEKLSKQQWQYVVDGVITDNEAWEFDEDIYERRQLGLEIFAKYFDHLWI